MNITRNHIFIIRILDIFFSFIGLFILFPILLIVTILGYFDSGSPLFTQKRIGLHKKPFILYKFRTMRKNTVEVPSHLAPPSAITRLGIFLRKSKLDELPQLINVLTGDMSLVGPRPNLPDQYELIEEREKRCVYDVRPGITGLAQLMKIDMSTPELLAITDAEMIKNFTLGKYFLYITMTVFGKGRGDRIRVSGAEK